MLKVNNWRWSRHLQAWYIPRSRDQLAKTAIIEATRDALHAAGFEVTVDIDDSASRSVEDRESEHAARARDRSELLQERAERRRVAADASWVASRRIADGIPLGQPILVGHHSERRHRRDLERTQNLTTKSVEESRAADKDQRRSDALAGATARRYSVRSVGRRITRLEAELRKVDRELKGYTRVIGGYNEVHAAANGLRAERTRLTVIELEAQLAYWCDVRDELASTEPTYSQEIIKKGDFVRICGHWRKVARANLKSVTVETDYSWTDRAPYHDITEHRSAEDMEGPGL
jgi:hypothetical protein